MKFAIVRFTDEEDAPGIVSTKWINENNTCMYPNVKTKEKINKLLLSHASPTKEWLICPMRLLKIFPSYHSARSHLREAEDTSDLESDADCKGPRKRKRKSFNFPDSSSEDESQTSLSCRQSESYPPPHSSSPLTSSSPPPLLPTLISSPHISRATSFNSDLSVNASSQSLNNEVLINKMEEILTNQQNMWLVMEDLVQSVKHIQHKLDTFLTNQDLQHTPFIAQDDEDEISFISLLPLGFDDFAKFDKKIAESSSFKKRLTNLCMAIGAKDARMLACCMLRKFVLDEVGIKYSLTGKARGTYQIKLPFEKTEVYKLILEICFRNFKDSKTNIVREAISDWLMQSKFRIIKREKRSEMKERKEREDWTHS